MPRFKSDPQRSWTLHSGSKPFPGTILRNSLSPGRMGLSSSAPGANSSSSYQVKSGLHPLGPLGEFNDIQRCITEAILVHGQPCPVDYILDFVAARWKSLLLSDASVRYSDPRKATLANLNSHSSSHILFEPSKSNPNRWNLVTAQSASSHGASSSSGAGSSSTVASSASQASSSGSSSDRGTSTRSGGRSSSGLSYTALLDGADFDFSADGSSLTPGRESSLRTTRARRTKRKRGDVMGGDLEPTSSSSDDDLPAELPGGRDAAYLLDLPRKKPKVYTPEELSYDASTIPPEELLERVKESKLTNLQILISISIIRSERYEAKLDYILDFVCQHYTYLLGRDGNPKATDPKRAVLASLSKNASSSPLFVKSGDVWKIGPKNVLYGSKDVIPGLMEYITVSKSTGDTVELTELQKMIMRAISLDGGTCGLEKIYEYVKPRYDRLKRRDGSSYATNARRAIQASLSNNSSNRPIFHLVGTNSDEETLWSLTDRGQEALEMINNNEPEQPFEEDSFDETMERIPSPARGGNERGGNDSSFSLDSTPSVPFGPHPTSSSSQLAISSQHLNNSSFDHSFRSSSSNVSSNAMMGLQHQGNPNNTSTSSTASLLFNPSSGSLSPMSITSTASEGGATSDNDSEEETPSRHFGVGSSSTFSSSNASNASKRTLHDVLPMAF